MSLSFVIGGSGSGKTTEILKRIIDESMEMPSKHFLVIVPEQFTMQTQKEIVRLHPFHSVMNIEILSFMRLAYRVFNETGSNTLGVLGDTGKSLILRKIFEDKKDELSVLKIGLKKAGYVSEIRSFLSELSQYGITPEELKEMGEAEGFPERFRMKIDDIVSIYEGFNEFIDGKYITTEDVLERLMDVSGKSELLKDSVIVLDGFTGFTPVQMKLLSTLIPLASQTYVTVTMDTDENFTGEVLEHELFQMSKKMIASLLQICREKAVEVGEPIYLKDSSTMRFKEASALSFLEQTIFRGTSEKCPDELYHEGSLNLYRLNDMNDEMDFVSAKIRELVRTEGYKYSDFAVVTSAVENYSYRAQNSFEKYSIPYFVDQTMKVTNHPLLEFVLRALMCVDKDFRVNDVLRLLKCRIPYLDSQDIAEFERYITSMNIRGWKKYSVPFTKKSRKYTEEVLGEIDNTREAFYELIAPFYSATHGKKTVREIATALYQLIESTLVYDYLKEHALSLREDGKEDLARQYEEIYDLLMDLLDKMVELLGDIKLSVAEFSKILEAGFDTLKVGMIPPANDCVIFGDIERTRLADIKVLFLIGATDELIPKADSRGGILSELEREKLKEMGYELALSARERAFRQRFYLYLTLTKASNSLFITSPKLNGDGKSARLSYIYSDIMKMFPMVRVIDESKFTKLERIVDEKTAMDALIKLMFAEKNQLLNDKDREVLSILLRYFNNENKEVLKEVLKNNFFKAIPKKLESEINAQLVRDKLEGSVSKLEEYATCPYKYYLKYLIRIDDWEDSNLNAIEMGSFYHSTLEKFSKKVRSSGKKWKELDETTVNDFLESSMKEIEDENYSRFKEEGESAFKLSMISDTLRQSVPYIVEQIQKSAFEPEGFEVDFRTWDRDEKLDALNYELEDGTMHLTGKIDRLDTFEDDENVYVKVVDYKSGNKGIDLQDTEAGLDIQMYVYMDATVEHIEHSLKMEGSEKKVVPAGLYYIRVTDEVDSDSTKDTPEDKYRKTLFKNGFINSDADVMRYLGEEKAKNKFTLEEWHKLRDGVRSLIVDSGNRMLKGDIDSKPFNKNGKTGCDYCPYHSVCHFDAKLDGYEYRKLD